jgi:ketol-acid reductoisomerase
MLNLRNKLILNPARTWYKSLSTIYQSRSINLVEQTEDVIIGGKDKFNLLSEGFRGIKQIGIIGWGSQAPSQALNLRDSLTSINSDINIKVGLRENSNSIKNVLANNFEVDTMENVLQESDLNLILISDTAQVNLHSKIFDNVKPGSTLGFSHGFLLGHLQNTNNHFPNNVNVIMMAPKGMGPTVRDKYLEGSGINSSIAVNQDIDGKAYDQVVSWALGTGSPYIFNTTMEKEYKSDIFGERAILLGGIHGLVEYLYRYFRNKNYYDLDAYFESVMSLTGTINETISSQGLLKLYEGLPKEDKNIFEENYKKSYLISQPLFEEIYREVNSGNEIRSVILHGEREIGEIGNSPLWKVGKRFNDNNEIETYQKAIVSKTAGMYLGAMMAQIDILIKEGHCYSEIVNESVIEATDSLNPYMYEKGISHMIDNCSVTARLGARKWASRLDYLYEQNMDSIDIADYDFNQFKNHPIHDVIEELYQYKN